MIEIVSRSEIKQRVETGPNGEPVVVRWREPTIGRCMCGRLLELEHFTNTCECGADYNSAGQLLAPRSQWGEETGESLADILSVDCDRDSEEEW